MMSLTEENKRKMRIGSTLNKFAKWRAVASVCFALEWSEINPKWNPIEKWTFCYQYIDLTDETIEWTEQPTFEEPKLCFMTQEAIDRMNNWLKLEPVLGKEQVFKDSKEDSYKLSDLPERCCTNVTEFLKPYPTHPKIGSDIFLFYNYFIFIL